MQYKYDSDSDVLAVFLSEKPFSYASEVGDVVVHFDKKDNPVYLEFLNAHKFLQNAANVLPENTLEKLVSSVSKSK